MPDHYRAAEQCLTAGQMSAAIAHALLALVDEFRHPDPTEPR